MPNAAMNMTGLSVFVQSSFKQLLLHVSMEGQVTLSVQGYLQMATLHIVSGYPGYAVIIRGWPPPYQTEYPLMTKLSWVYGDHPRLATLRNSPQLEYLCR